MNRRRRGGTGYIIGTGFDVIVCIMVRAVKKTCPFKIIFCYIKFVHADINFIVSLASVDCADL